jgi:outer membrane protein insertion porin family
MVIGKDQMRQVRFTKQTLILASVLMFVCVVYANAQSEEAVISTEGISTVVIKAFNNSIRIMPWDRSDVIVKAIKGGTNIEIPKIERKENRLELEMPKSSDLEEYEIYVPEDIGLEVTSMNASVYITGVKGKKKIEAFNGNIEIRDVVGSVSAKTFNGNIIADVRFDEKSDFATVSGFIDILITDNFSVPLSINTVSGSVTLNLPEGYWTDLDASAISGQVTCDVPIDGGIEGHSIKGKIYGGGPALKLRTISGNISIKPAQTVSELSSEQPMEYTDKPKVIEKPKIRKADKSILPRIEVAKTLDPPKIDGRLDDNSWKNASKIESFVWADGIGKPNEATEAYLLWDDQNLYIGVRCFESNMDNVKITHTEGDEWLWEDDDIQILIDPTPNNIMDYYHIIVNPIGVVFDQEVNIVQPENRRTIESKLGRKWDFAGEVDTDIRDNFWTVEISIPFSSIAKTKPQANDLWKFNLHRIEQRRKEYTYWSPTYFAPDWPHIPARFGELVFSADQLSIETPDQSQLPTETSSEAKLVEIIIEGNNRITQEDIIEALKLKIGYVANFDMLTRAKIRLEALGWFQNVNMDLIKNEAGIKLRVKLTEKDVISPSEIVITGSIIWTKEEIIDFFNLKPSKMTSQDVAVKCKLIADLYKSRDYEMAMAKFSFNENVLNIDIDEGRIDKIEVYGNNKIKTDDILKALNLKTGTPYKRSDINDAIKAMQNKLPYFRHVRWTPKKSDDGLNIVSIEVKEGRFIEPDFQSITDFDRVHGFSLGVRPGLTSKYWGSKVFFSIRYGFSSEIWNYQFGAEKSFFRNNKTTFGLDIHKLTDTNDREIISDKEHVIAEFVLGEAFRDFYQREGYEVNFSQKLPVAMQLGAKYKDDVYASLVKTEDWSIFNRSYTEEYKDIDYKIKRRNPPILDGRMKSVIAECAFDTRNKEVTRGWYNTFSAEYAGGKLGGDYDFKIYQANIRRYDRIARNQFFAFRVKAGIADRELEVDHPKRFYLGGIGTLRGYSYKEFEGDKMALMNAEYWFRTGHFGLGMSVFVDSGYVWNYNDEMKVNDLKTDIGVGIALGSNPGNGLVFNIATPIDEKDRETIVSVRLDKMF